jgi:hypothetical protein
LTIAISSIYRSTVWQLSAEPTRSRIESRTSAFRKTENLKTCRPRPTGSRDLSPRAGPRLDSPPQVARFAASGSVSPSAPNPHAGSNRVTPGHSRALRISRNSVFAVFRRVRRPNTSRDSVRVRFGKFSDMVFGNRLIVFGFRYATARTRQSIPESQFRDRFG